MIASSTAEASRSTTTINLVTFEDAFLRFGCSIRVSRSSSAMRSRPYNLHPGGAPDVVSGRGGIGRRARLRTSWPQAVGVRVPPPASRLSVTHREYPNRAVRDHLRPMGRITLHQGDITKDAEADAIVNAANSRL